MENGKINIRNDEHYMDTTPYNALNEMQPKDGEIWTYGENGGMCLVIKAHGAFCNVLRLLDIQKSETIEIPVWENAEPMYTNPAFIQYLMTNNFANFVKRMPYEDFKYVLSTVRDALGFEGVENIEPLKVAYETHIENLEEELARKTDEARKAFEFAENVKKERMKDGARYETMKNLYYELLERVVEKSI